MGKERQAGKIDGMDRDVMLAQARATWPDMARYLSAATVGRGMAWDNERQMCVERDGVVVVEVQVAAQSGTKG